MKRRTFIAGLGGAVAWPLVASGQQPPMRVIGFLALGSLKTTSELVAAVHRGLSETGYVEGRNLSVEYRWAEDRLDSLPALAKDLVHYQVAVIVAFATPTELVAKAATDSIPIVFLVGADPVKAGLVTSFARTRSNLTGVTNLNIEVAAKRLELLHELEPATTSIAFLVDPTNPAAAQDEASVLQLAARTLGVRLLTLNAKDQSEIDAAFATLVNERAGGLVVSSSPLFTGQSDKIIGLAARHAVPAMYSSRAETAAGGLMSYGTDFPDLFRQVGVYVGRILNGEKPADLPVQQVTKMQLVINMKTAKALRLTIPLPLLGRADEVIE